MLRGEPVWRRGDLTYRDVGVKDSDIAGGLEVRHDVRLVRGGDLANDVHGLITMGGQNDVVEDIELLMLAV